MRIYVAGKLNAMAAEYLENVSKMMSAAEALRSRGHSPYVPCLDLLMGIKYGYYKYNDYFSMSQPWLEVADALLVLPGWQDSEGTKKEVTRALELGIPVCFSIDEVSDLNATVRTKLA